MFRFLLFVPVLFAQNAVDPRAALQNAARSLVRYQPPKAAVPVLVTPAAGPCAVPLVQVTPPASSKITVVPPQATSNMPIVAVPAPPCPAK